MKKAAVIIPARFGSSRFPGKPLEKIGGKPMIEWVFNQATKANFVSSIYIATDNVEIRETVLSFGGKVIMTSENCASGTDRCAEAVLIRSIEEEIIVNIQGDEPFIQPKQIEDLIGLMQSNHVQIGTLMKPIFEESAIQNPNVVKVVSSKNGKALYFSRNAIPYIRDKQEKSLLEPGAFHKHIGMYAYKKEVLLAIARLPEGQFEKLEKLEQLRWLEAGFEIFVAKTNLESIGIDTVEDLAFAEKWLSENEQIW
jgi:3-deoxy-manno-octulosonate cytidylyltransferase (CMP-KDO synthetase)